MDITVLLIDSPKIIAENLKNSKFFLIKINSFQNTNTSENADIDFQYNDADSHPNEIAELYSYTEQSEFQQNVKAFDELMESFKLQPSWQKLSDVTRRSVVLKLLDQLELSDQAARMKSARCLLYLAQVMGTIIN